MPKTSFRTAIIVGICAFGGGYITQQLIQPKGSEERPVSHVAMASEEAEAEYVEANSLDQELETLEQRLTDAVDEFANGQRSAAVAQLHDASTNLRLLRERAETEDIKMALAKTVRDLQQLADGVQNDKILKAEDLRADAAEVFKRLSAAVENAKRAARSGPDSVDAPVVGN